MARQTDIRLRRGSAASWAATNPVLNAGEPGLESDTGKVKWGDGVTVWNSLPYLSSVDSSKEPAFSAGTIGQYLRGDKSWQTLNQASVGLSNVDNTSDLAKPISTATQTALNGKANTVHTHTTADITSGLLISDRLALSNDSTILLDNPEWIGGSITGWGGITGSDIKGITDGPIKASCYILERTGNSAVQDFTNKVIPTAPNEKFYVKVWVRKTVAQTVDGTVQFGTTVMSKTNVASWPAISIQAAALTLNTWTPVEGIITVPSDGATIQPRLSIRNNMVDGTFQFANPTMRRMLIDNDISTVSASKITGLTKSSVGLSLVDNTADASKPVSTAQQTALNLKANLASPAFTGTPTGITKAHVGLGSVDNTSDASKPVSTAQQTALDLKANLNSPAFTGTPTGITKSHVGLGSVDNTSDLSKPISTLQQAALDAKLGVMDGSIVGTSGRQFRMIGCVIRNDGTGSGFQFISDAGHYPSGVSSVVTYSDRIVINYSFTANRVISAAVTPDETLAQYGYTMGPSVGTSSMTIYVGQPGGFADYVTANGASVSSLNGFITGMTRSTTTWTFNHGTIKGPTGGQASYRGASYDGVIEGLGATTTNVSLWSRSTGAQVNPSIQPSGTPYSFWIYRSGTRQVNPLTELDMANSNIWITALMEL
jgi:hypothetical protein